MDTFKTDDAVRTWMLDNTGLLSTEYKVHHIHAGSMLPTGMYVTFKHHSTFQYKHQPNPLLPNSIKQVAEAMQQDGYAAQYVCEIDGPHCILLQ